MTVRRSGFLLSLFLSIACASPLVAQNKYNLSQLGDETAAFIELPIHWEGTDWLKLGLTGAGTFLLMQTDQPVRTAVMKDRSYYNSVPIEGGRIWGELYTPVALFALLGAHSLATGGNDTRKIAFEIGQASFYAGAITFLLKAAIGRARPFTEEGRASYHPFTLSDDDDHSLPGGHATVAFALSTVLSKNAHSDFLKGLAYVPAVFTVVSRVYQDEHWFSDCVLGAAIGSVVGAWVVDRHEHEQSRVQIPSVYPFTVRITFD